eukprot:TRINITY_DN21429_c0_g1_i1.p1 TRINITY_DN21429_c0_g1~~TRINITY_DN21429_c0_g1_i1.p1  ORF type:complete len:177 (+),score=21.66 TRINITY_DN21429_c0_g1_i1:123-653(+)
MGKALSFINQNNFTAKRSAVYETWSPYIPAEHCNYFLDLVTTYDNRMGFFLHLVREYFLLQRKQKEKLIPSPTAVYQSAITGCVASTRLGLAVRLWPKDAPALLKMLLYACPLPAAVLHAADNISPQCIEDCQSLGLLWQTPQKEYTFTSNFFASALLLYFGEKDRKTPIPFFCKV